jgi:hypothetical protein
LSAILNIRTQNSRNEGKHNITTKVPTRSPTQLVENGCVALSIDSINQYMIYCVVKCNSVIDINHTYKWLFPPYNCGHQDDGKTHILLWNHWEDLYITVKSSGRPIYDCEIIGKTHILLWNHWEDPYITVKSLGRPIYYCEFIGKTHILLWNHWEDPYITVKSLGRPIYYCQIIINRGVLMFLTLNHENKNPTNYNFPVDCCL